MSSYILGDSWPIRPSWSTYMQKSTYKHDFGQGQTVNSTKSFPRSYYDTAAMNRHPYEPSPRGARDDTRLPLNQGRGFDGHRQEGPYTDRGGYNRFDDYYYGRYRDIRYPDRVDYERRHDPYYNEGHYTDRPGDYERRHDHYYNDGPHTDRPRFDRRDGSLERGYDRRPDDRNGPYTDRGEYDRRGGMNDPYIDKRRDERDMYHNPQPRFEQRMPNDEPQIYDKYANNRTTQKDYGDFQSQPRQRVERPHAYRGQVDKEIDAFHNKKCDIITGAYNIVPEQIKGKMAEGYRTYDYRLRHLENNLVDQDGKLYQYHNRNDTHSARLKMMEKELQEIKAENDVLFDEVVTLKSKGIKSRIDDEYVRDIRQPRRPEGVSNVRYNISDSRIQEPVNNELKMDLGQEDMYFSDEEVPGSSRAQGYYRFKSIPYYNRMLLNDNYTKHISPRGEAQRKKEYDRIEMHDGNFKPYASEAYYRHLTNRFPDIDNSAPETPDVPRRRDKDENYIDDIYLRPEEKQVRNRNMEFEYDAQQRLPLNIAPQTDYKSNIQRPARSESGAYLFIRTQKDAMFDIKRSFQRHKSILKMSGHLKGVATPDKISVMGDFTNWHIKSPMIRKGEYWYEQSGGVINHEYGTDYVILCLWFPSVDTAKLWIHYDVDFKIASFPEPYGVEILILPINYIPMDDIECSTFVMTEYPEIVNKEGLKKYVKDPMEDLLVKDSKYQRCEPFVVWTDRIVMERGMWVSSRSMMAVHRFRSLNQAREFYNDPRIERIRRELKDITKGGRHTTVMFQLVDFI